MCVCVCNVSVVCIEIYYFKSSCLHYNVCICFILPSLQFFVCYLTASLCVHNFSFCLCMSQVFLCACMECNISVWLCEFVPVCTCVCVCAHCIVYGISVFVCLHGLQHSKLVMCVSVCTEWCISQAFCMPEWIAVFQFSCVCLCMCLCTLHGVHHRCLFVVACMDCNIPI